MFRIDVNISSFPLAYILMLFSDLALESQVMFLQSYLRFWKQSQQKLRSLSADCLVALCLWNCQKLIYYRDRFERTDLSSPLRTLPIARHMRKDFQNLFIYYYKKQADAKIGFQGRKIYYDQSIFKIYLVQLVQLYVFRTIKRKKYMKKVKIFQCETIHLQLPKLQIKYNLIFLGCYSFPQQLFPFIIVKLMQGVAQSHYAITTFSTCEKQSCISNIVQISLVGLLMLWLVYEFVMQIKLHMRLHFSWQEVLFVQIFLCLSFNICFTLWPDVIIWYVMESFIFQIYFTTLVYYFSIKYFQKTIKIQQRKPYIVTLIIVYVIFCLFELGLFIALVNEGSGRCKQIGEIIINAIMIVLGAVFFYLAYRNQTEEKKKFQEFQVNYSGKNPLRDIWIWVCCNIVGQIFTLTQSSLIYSYYGHQQCTPVEGNLESNILTCIFVLLTYVISFSSTLWFYHQRRLQEQQRFQMNYSQLQLSSAQADVENRVEFLKYSSYNESSFRNSLMQPLK